jgi:hypothetical protein
MWHPTSNPPPRSLPKVLSIFSMHPKGYLDLMPESAKIARY